MTYCLGLYMSFIFYLSRNVCLSKVSKNEILSWNSMHSKMQENNMPYTLSQIHSTNSVIYTRKYSVRCPWVIWKTSLSRTVFVLKSCQENLTSSISTGWWGPSAPGKRRRADDIRTSQHYNHKMLGHAKHLDTSFIHFLYYKQHSFTC